MISEFFFQIAELKKLPRSGWKIKVGLENSESVAEHSYMMSVMSMVCLLYTSPSPRDKRQSRMPSSA